MQAGLSWCLVSRKYLNQQQTPSMYGHQGYTDTKVLACVLCSDCCACTPPQHRASKTRFVSCLATTLPLPVPSFLLVPAAPGGSLAGSSRHSQLMQPCSCSVGCSKERKEDLAEMRHLFLCWQAPETTLSVHIEQRKVGFCEGPPLVTICALTTAYKTRAQLLPGSAPLLQPMASGTISPCPAPRPPSYLGWQEKVPCSLSHSLSAKLLTLDPEVKCWAS